MSKPEPTPSILDHVGQTPLVELRRIGAGLPVPLLAKCEHMNPGGSVKDRIAVAIIEDAERSGRLRPGDTLVEATAGNTGIGLAIVAAVKGYALVCVMPEKMSADKRTALAQLGARVVVARNAPPGDPDNFQQVALRLAAENGWFLTDQFRNPANVEVHERQTGPEILEQARGQVGAFVAGVGTGGTITGVGRYLKAHCPAAQVVLADPVGSGLAGWVRDRALGPDGAYAVEGIGSSAVPEVFDASVVDSAEEVSDEESFAMVGRLIREEGLLVGGSSGTAVVAAVRTAAKSPPGPVVVLLADGWDRYRSKPWMQGLGVEDS
jgi:cysteine synthase